jgi:hypothetical protein
MQTLDEQHEVSIVSIEGVSRVIATGRLNESQSVQDLKDQVEIEFGNDNDAMTAFDNAFEQCEARPGNASTAEAMFNLGTIVVKRTLAA